MTGLDIQDTKLPNSPWSNWKGSILLAPPIAQTVSPSWIQVKLLEFVHFLGGSSLALGPKPDKTKFPSENDWNLFTTDPFTYTGRMKLAFGVTLLNLVDTLGETLTKIRFPYLVVHGDVDPVTPLSGSQLLLEKSTTPETLKKLVVFPGVKHNVMTHGIAQEKSVPVLLEWMTQRLASEQSNRL